MEDVQSQPGFFTGKASCSLKQTDVLIKTSTNTDEAVHSQTSVSLQLFVWVQLLTLARWPNTLHLHLVCAHGTVWLRGFTCQMFVYLKLNGCLRSLKKKDILGLLFWPPGFQVYSWMFTALRLVEDPFFRSNFAVLLCLLLCRLHHWWAFLTLR